jgi:stage II sporulation protein D
MRATSSLELLKAHAVISRSWLLAQIEKHKQLRSETTNYASSSETESERVKWYDREDHDNFDVCADDHCQRYQGITKASTKLVEQAISETFGETLMYDGQICDARFSKCCGGKMEVFENVWEPVIHPYLQPLIDYDNNPDGYELDLENEASAEKWILGNPEAYCNTNDKKVLSQVLNDYDQETNNFYRWEVRYSQEEVSDLIKKRYWSRPGIGSGIHPGRAWLVWPPDQIENCWFKKDHDHWQGVGNSQSTQRISSLQFSDRI